MKLTVKRWIDTVAEFGPVVPGDGWTEVHHVVGRTYRQDKILIGPWFIIALPAQYHASQWGDPDNVTDYRHRFTSKFGLQKDLFAGMVQILQNTGIAVPSIEILTAIQATNR